MPLYDFECSQCGFAFEELLAADSSNVPVCPECGCGETFKKMSCHSPMPGSGKDRMPGSLLRGRNSKLEQVPVINKPSTPSPCSGSCGSCSSGSGSID